jgi:hypothetical protein
VSLFLRGYNGLAKPQVTYLTSAAPRQLLMVIDKSRQRPSYFTAADRKQLIRLVALLVFVLIAMKVVAKPGFWSWMFPEQHAADQISSETTTEPGVDSEALRTPLVQPVAVLPQDNAATTSTNSTNSETHATGIADSARRIRGELTNEFAVDTISLALIQDDTLGIRENEADAFYALLAKVRRISLSDLEASARADATYTALLTAPEQFRGSLVTVEGEVKRLVQIAAGENRYGVDELYEAWLFSADSGENPYRLLCTALPTGIPQGAELKTRVRVRVTGYFFKRQGYAARHGLHSAPVLLAHTLRWLRPLDSREKLVASNPLFILLIVLIGTAVCVAVWRVAQQDWMFRRKHLKPTAAATIPSAEDFDGIEMSELGERLQQVAEEIERESSSSIPESRDSMGS